MTFEDVNPSVEFDLAAGNPWDVANSTFPATGSTQEKLKYLLQYAVLAASSHNSQPWLFSVENDTVNVFADLRRALPVADPTNREMYMSVGGCIAHLDLAIRCLMLVEPIITFFPDTSSMAHVARITLGDAYSPSENTQKRFHAIPERCSYRFPFTDMPLPAAARQGILDIVNAFEGVRVYIAESQESRKKIIDYVVEADLEQGNNQAYCDELSQWIRPNSSTAKDGLPGFAFGVGSFASHLGAFFTRYMRWGPNQAEQHKHLLSHQQSSAILVLGTDNDTFSDWVRVGMAAAHIHLFLTSINMSLSYVNQPLQTRHRYQLGADVQLDHPQVCLRVGHLPFDDTPIHTPRRPLAECLR